ncbi:transcription factor E2F8-like isoform X2 [Zootermopsis nevadensis]|uniref:transcription factor E2F8-like isoform X2 n=1 Tax=Zootermopsis nevadensis TaxID=136037 RepID=UPI000B8EA6B9|nr:transcription factor E2F8-like isoform X2 [Zootermopsis nevadensis]
MNVNMSPGRKILSEINHLGKCEDGTNPLSPTANLKLLTKVASSLERNCTTDACINKEDVPKVKKRLSLGSVQQLPDEHLKSRKEKSLNLLCNRFLQLFPLNLSPGDYMVISLDQAANNLGTERRRIYDIVNVLESLQMAAKVAKKRYMWYGCQQLHNTLALLKGLALRLGLHNQVHSLQLKRKTNLGCVVAGSCNEAITDSWQPELECSDIILQTHSLLDPCEHTPPQPKLRNDVSVESWDSTEMGESSQTDTTLFLDSCAERSLGVLSQRFIMLFLISSKSDLVNLDFATSVLLSKNMVDKNIEETDVLPCCQHANPSGQSASGGTKAVRLKTKVRRLYDIANIFTSVGLICKVPGVESNVRKPAFKYIGPQVEAAVFSDQDIQQFQATRHSLLGNASYLRLQKPLLSFKASIKHHKRKQCDSGSCEMFTHIRSECRSGPSKRKAYHLAEDDGSLSDIFHVAEIELKRLESLEMSGSQKSVRKKLFSRHHSESCIVRTGHHPQPEQGGTKSLKLALLGQL